VDEIWNISDRPWCALTKEKWGKLPQGFCPRVPNCVLFFCDQCNAAFRPLIVHRFRPFLKQQTWIAFRMHTPVRNFRISARGFPGPQNSPKYGSLGTVFVIELQLKRHNCARWESFWGLWSTSQRCAFCTRVLVGYVRFGRYKPRKKPKFWRLHYLTWPNRITVGVNSSRNHLLLGTLLYSYT